MALQFSEDQLSDDEIFFGKLTIKEVKKHILWSDHKQNTKNKHNYEDIKIIETHSEPDLNKKGLNSPPKKVVSNTNLSPDTPLFSNWNIKPADDSFLQVEKMVTDLCQSQESEKVTQLNNTLDIIDYILNNGPTQTSPLKNNENNNLEIRDTNNVVDKALSSLTQDKLKTNDDFIKSPKKSTPVNTQKQSQSSLVTPSTNLKQNELFKTPKNPFSQKKPSTSSLKRTPSKNNAYQHIASPIASYIKNCPVTPLVKEVRPMRPLPGTSSIPKYVSSVKSSCKENIDLPPVAYKSAKKTKVITMPGEEKLPETLFMKKITSSLPKPVILKHNHREMNYAKRILGSKQEDSFADLSLRQADVSVCTKKSAFNKPKKPL
ncbi:unnamed protein product [Diatraea saccharalis]|uniref:Uncharacterized protein n=1 Tax=Diatraea saccharalis TaxID=40085 RepID=A0A9N9RI36_9NEOP|nr:unnamed protein product [Diatraea saccharalis]